MFNAKDVVLAIGDVMVENRQFLTDLDSPIGDSDHGINMARGYEACVDKLGEVDANDIAAVLKKTAMTLLSTVGGAAGPLYATAYLRAAAAIGDSKAIDLDAAIAMMEAAIKGIMDRGKATAGCKTMLDAMIPACDAMKEAKQQGKSLAAAMDDAVKAAEDGVEYTKTIIATKGRACYLGERSIGHQDPGATSFTLSLKVLRDFAYKAEA